MSDKITVRFLLWVYLLLLGFIIVITVLVFRMYGQLASSTQEITNVEAHKAAVETFGTVAQSFADLIKVTVGAVIGALGAALQSLLSKKAVAEKTAEIEEDQTVSSGSGKKKDQKK